MGLQSLQLIPCESDVCMRHTYCSVFCLSGRHSADAGSSYFVFVPFYCLLFCFGPFHFEGFSSSCNPCLLFYAGMHRFLSSPSFHASHIASLSCWSFLRNHSPFRATGLFFLSVFHHFLFPSFCSHFKRIWCFISSHMSTRIFVLLKLTILDL